MSRQRYRTASSPGKTKPKLLPLILVLLFLTAGVGALFLMDGKEEEGPDSAQKTVEINGVTCVPRQNLRTYLFMGIDNQGEDSEEAVYGGHCDVIRLIVVDQSHNTYIQLPINRNTMTDVHTYSSDTGKDLGTSHVQLSFAHASGGDYNGPKSCENVVRAVSDLLYGQEIDGYASLNMSSISTVNHLAGGVTVTIEDDFSQSDPSLVMGETITLNDQQAYNFVRGRMSVGDGTNEGRMRRQDAYIDGLKVQMTKKIKADNSYPIEIYRTLSDEMVTNLSEKEFSRIANALVNYESQGQLEITGTIGEDEFGFATLELDQDSLADAVIDLFYTRVE